MAVSRRILLAGNWKMYKTRAEAAAFVQELCQLAAEKPAPAIDLTLCASFTLLETLKREQGQAQQKFSVAAQTMESRSEGAYTGEVSPAMLNDLAVEAVILGHSERRQYFNETDAALNAKVKAAFDACLTPILCVGETLEQREAGATDTVVIEQLRLGLAGLSPEALAKVIIAYEPVWAIGTGKVCEAPEANRVCALLRQELKALSNETTAETVRVLYGGSMKPENVQELLSQSDIDGGLIGGASLKADSFWSMAVLAQAQSQLVSSAV